MSEKIERKVLESIKPKPHEFEEVKEIFNLVRNRIFEELKTCNVKAEIELEGSVAKDTWLSGEWDLDVFVLYPKILGKNWVKTKGFEIIQAAVKDLPHEIAYAEHPYVRLKIRGHEVDVIPALKLNHAWEAKTVVDKTPFHTRYVKSQLKEYQKNHVRLLKKFLKGIEVYGAEIKVSGFSGYLTELLIIYYGTFRNVLKKVVEEWCSGYVIDIEKYYDDLNLVRKKFGNQPLIVVDPVDPNRNVAAAVSEKSLSTFIAASKHYLKKPSITFFFPKKKHVSIKNIIESIKRRGTGIVIILFATPNKPPDTLWGLLKRNIVSVVNLLREFDFEVLDYAVWSDEKLWTIFIIELKQTILPQVTKSKGPPVFLEPNASQFLEKYLASEETIAGPWIENSRWIVLKKRKYVSVRDLLIERMLDHGLSNILKRHLENYGFEIFINTEIEKCLRKVNNDLLLDFIAKFLEKKPLWLS